MTQEEINDYNKIQLDLQTTQTEVESLKFSLKIAQEELAQLTGLIQRKEIQTNVESYTLTREKLLDEKRETEENLAAQKKQQIELAKEGNTVKENISACNKKIAELKPKLTDAEAKLSALNEQSPSPERDKEILRISEEIKSINSQITALETELAKNETELTKINQKIAENDLEIKKSEEQLTYNNQQIAALDDQFAPNQKELNVLYESRSTKKKGIESLSGALTLQLEHLTFIRDSFSRISDPRNLIRAINDETPFLLFPVRVETRFMTVKHVKRVDDITTVPVEENQETSRYSSAQTTEKIRQILQTETEAVPDKKELWVRIFPDDIAIHTHETRLTFDEFEAGKTYWNTLWGLDPNEQADENIRLGAWRVLTASYGSERSAWIVDQSEPENLHITPLPGVPVFPSLVLKPTSWSEQPVSKIMPDRFVVRLYSSTTQREVLGNLIPDPLPVGFDPSSANLENEFEQLNTTIEFPHDIQWLSDFQKAEQVGMGIRILLEKDESVTGFDKILVLGVKLSLSKNASKERLEGLIDNHHYTSGGFSLVPQGTPTNNTEDVASGYESYETEHENSFETEVGEPLFTHETDRFLKSDGQWFSEMLGISEEKLQHIRYADRFDQQEEMAMNTALWPATMGYYMKQMLAPLVFSKQQNDIRSFFTDHATARGRIPSFRVKNQPYGVMITSAFSKWKYPTVPTNTQLYTLKLMQEKFLLPLNSEYNRLVNYVLHADSPGDKQENFLKILGLHASSVEYHQRFGSGQHFSWNVLKYFENAPSPGTGEEILEMNPSVPEALRSLMNTTIGINLPLSPRILEMLFVQKERLLNGPVIDLDRLIPFSEFRGIQSFPGTTTNYIEWMLMSDFFRIRFEKFDNIAGIQNNQKPPKALLYLLLRQGYLLEHLNAAMQILRSQRIIYAEAEVEFELHKEINDNGISVEEAAVVDKLVTAELTLLYELELEDRIQQMEADGTVNSSTREAMKERLRRSEASGLERNIRTEQSTRKSRYFVEQKKWNYLELKIPSLDGKTALEIILENLSLNDPFTGYLAKMQRSLDVLCEMPTARLERCLAESLDLCNYRLDGWLMGLVGMRAEQQLESGRKNGSDGVYLGSFGILEQVRPNLAFPGIAVVETESDASATSETFVYLGNDSNTILNWDDEMNTVVAPPRENSENLGFIHGPSMNHAVTAAILRAGYGGHEGTDSPDNALAINLRSDRIRKAMFYIEGIRNGQELASLLGYQFERALHDRNEELDQYILDIRRIFPLVANGVVEDNPIEGSIEAFEARNVVNGLKLIEAYRDNPSGWSNGIIGNTSVIQAINEEIITVMDHMDAIGDLMMSESIFQIATGNQERAGAVMKALGEGNLIPDPQIVRTPRLDKVFVQRMSILFDTSSGNAQIWSGNASARSYCEPALNAWLAKVLPDPDDVIINYQYTTIDGSGDEIITDSQMTLSDLGLQPVDFLFLMTDQGNGEDGTQLSALINYMVIHTVSFTEIPVTIKFIDRTNLTDNQLTIFELLPLVGAIRDLIGQGRPARAEDFLIEGEVYNVRQQAAPGEGMILTNIETRMTEAFGSAASITGLGDIKTNLMNAKAAVDSLTDIIGAESALDNLRSALLNTRNFAVQGYVPETAYTYSLEVRDLLSSQAARILSQLSVIETTVSGLFTDLNSITDPEDRLDQLQQIGKTLFGRNFKVFPEFNFFNQADIDLSFSNTDLLASGGDFAVEEWLQGIAKVRPRMSNYHLQSMIGESLLDRSPEHKVIQLPIVSNVNDRWLGCQLPEEYPIPDQAISLVLDVPQNYATSNLQSGIILDEWTESIPESSAITGLTFNFDQPNSEAPNTLLLAVTPEVTGNWDWNDLMNILDETLMMAKKRAIDPDIINKQSILGHALPAIVASVEASDSAPGLDFSRNIVPAPSGQVGPISIKDYPAL